jgi:hypothetical protein
MMLSAIPAVPIYKNTDISNNRFCMSEITTTTLPLRKIAQHPSMQLVGTY